MTDDELIEYLRGVNTKPATRELAEEVVNTLKEWTSSGKPPTWVNVVQSSEYQTLVEGPLKPLIMRVVLERRNERDRGKRV